ncbi:MAG TPA: hypothetical protein VMZ00_11110 [Sporichthya sp.]|nr:hypothetical protein [Sporichthya sp.]
MEVLVGFAVGFVVGTKQGSDGVAKVIESFNAIRSSKEVQKLVESALVMGMPMMKELAKAARV